MEHLANPVREELSNRVNIYSREVGSKAFLRKLRREKKIPAIIYGVGFASKPVWVDAKEILKIISHSKTSVLNLSDGKKEISAIIREVSYDAVTETVNHIDFMKLQAKREIELKVPVEIVGSSPGVKEGGILDFVTREVEIKTLPTSIPESLKIDVSSTEIGHVLKISDIKVPEGVAVLTPGDSICITVQAPRKEEEVLEKAEEEEAAAAEPEVIKKGKEEGEPEDKEKEKGEGKKQPEPPGKKEKKDK